MRTTSLPEYLERIQTEYTDAINLGGTAAILKVRPTPEQIRTSKIPPPYGYVEEIPPITNVVFSGGGAKGVIYPGVIQGFEGQMVVKDGKQMPASHALEAVAGSSVGAMTAAFFAAGISGDELAKIAETDFEELFSEKFRPINKDGIPLKKFLDEKIRNSVKDFLNSIHLEDANVEQLSIYPSLNDYERTRSLLELKELAAGTNPKLKITFRHLALLRKFNPEKFKDLYVTSVCGDDGKVIIFSDEETPDMPIALAARASASLPILFEPAKFKRKYLPISLKSYANKPFTDGGYLNNIPLEVFQRRKFNKGNNFGENNQNYQTLVCAFDDDKDPNNQQSRLLDAEVTPKFYRPSDIEKYIRNVVAKYLGNLKFREDNTTASEDKYELIRRDYATRVIALPVSEIEIHEFEKAKKMRAIFIDRGKAIIQNFFMYHYNAKKPVIDEFDGKKVVIQQYDGRLYAPECAHQTFDNPIDLLLAMPWNKLKLLLKQTPNFEGIKVHKIVLVRMQLNKILDSNLPEHGKVNELEKMLNTQQDTLGSMNKHKLPPDEKAIQESIVNHVKKIYKKLYHTHQLMIFINHLNETLLTQTTPQEKLDELIKILSARQITLEKMKELREVKEVKEHELPLDEIEVQQAMIDHMKKIFQELSTEINISQKAETSIADDLANAARRFGKTMDEAQTEFSKYLDVSLVNIFSFFGNSNSPSGNRSAASPQNSPQGTSPNNSPRKASDPSVPAEDQDEPLKDNRPRNKPNNSSGTE